jgi:hypothetical protein
LEQTWKITSSGRERLLRRASMSENKQKNRLQHLKLTLDGWAVATAFVLALLVRVGLLKRVPW